LQRKNDSLHRQQQQHRNFTAAAFERGVGGEIATATPLHYELNNDEGPSPPSSAQLHRQMSEQSERQIDDLQMQLKQSITVETALRARLVVLSFCFGW
jgi:hypothetical protein